MDEIRTASLPSSEANNDRSGIGQGDLGSHLRPAKQGWALQMKEEKHALKEALDATAFAKLFFVWFHYASITAPLRFLLILKGEDEGQPVAEGVMRLSGMRMIS
jgi:hypothetical protein